jgi:hypothetical protein
VEGSPAHPDPGGEDDGATFPVDGAALFVLAALLAVVLAPRTAGFTVDSDSYLDVAGNLLAGQGLVQRVVDFWRSGVPQPLGLWPPVYPALVALVSAFGMPLEASARATAGAGFAAFAFAFHALATRALGRGPGALATALALALPGVALLGAFAWSESSALAFLAAGLAVLFAGAPPVSRRRALAAGALLALAALTRHAALVVVVALVAAVLASPRLRGARGVFALAALLPPAAWLGRNLALFGRPFGPALPPSPATPGAQGFEMARALRYELLPAPFDGSLAASVLLGLVLLAGVVLALRAGGIARACALVAVAHLAAVLAGTSTVAINAPTGRYLAPALPFLVLAALAGLRGTARSDGTRRALVTGLAAVLAIAAGLELLGEGRARPSPAPGELARRHDRGALRDLVPPGTAPVLSDQGHAVRLHTGRSTVQVPPAEFRPRAYDARDDARWAAAGVREAVFAEAAPPAGAWKARATAGRFTYWVRSDSGAP